MPEPALPYRDLEPLGENALVLYWASLAVMAMFDYDYVHYRKAIQDVRKYFTAPGHDRFITALLDSKNLETVKSRSAVLIPEITGKIELTKTYYFYGHYVWDVKVPLKLLFDSARNEDSLELLMDADLSIARISTLKSPFYGLAIFKVNFSQRFES